MLEPNLKKACHLDTRGWASVKGIAHRNIFDFNTMILYHWESNELNVTASRQRKTARFLNSDTMADRHAACPNASASRDKQVIAKQAVHNDITWQDVARARHLAQVLRKYYLDRSWKPGAASTRRPLVISVKEMALRCAAWRSSLSLLDSAEMFQSHLPREELMRAIDAGLCPQLQSTRANPRITSKWAMECL